MTNVESGVRAVALLSGGLDSHLAVKLVLDQGVEVHAINFVTPFCTCTAQGCRSEARGAAEQLGIPLKVANNSRPLLEAIKSPRFCFGRGLNPCLDCRVISFERAAAYMDEIGASFLVTGEVLGQRPMSQMRRSIEKIEKESGLKGRILRPLSAHHFPPTEVEKEGLIDRDKLLSISGRSRRIQIDVAEELGVNDIRVRLAAVFSRNLTLLTGCVVCCASTILPRCPRLRCSSPGATSSLRTDSGSSFLATRWRTVG